MMRREYRPVNYKVIHQLKEREFVENVSKSEEMVLDYLKDHFDDIPQMTAIELSQESFTSQATINRTCKVLGFKGFSELKYAIEEDLALMHSPSKRSMSKTEFFLDKINFDEAQKIKSYLLEKECKVMVYALGGTSIAAEYFQRQLLYLGIPALLINQEQMLEHLNDHVLIILSSSGETLRVVQVAKAAKQKGILLLSLTKKDSTLAEISDQVFSHHIRIDKLDGIVREQQLHLIMMVNELIDLISSELD